MGVDRRMLSLGGALALAALLALAVAVVTPAASSSAGGAPGPDLPLVSFARDWHGGDARAGARAATFVSLVPACACGRHTELDEFSLSTGRRLRKLASISVPAGNQLAIPEAQRSGRLLLTFTSGPLCAVSGNFSQCPRIAPNSCHSQIDALDPGRLTLTRLFAGPGSRAINDVVPSPGGNRVALSATPCTQPQGTTGLFIRDFATGRERAIITSDNRCDGFGPTAWNVSATELVFVYDRATRPAHAGGGGQLFCPDTRNRLAIASTNRTPAAVKLIAPDRGCAFTAAAFDRRGIAAAEGCRKGSPRGFSDTGLGDAYLLQLDHHARMIRRVALKRGMEEAVVATEPNPGDVLVTQDQPANQGPEFDWVWEFDGVRVRPVAHYRAYDAAQVVAVPW